MVNDFLLETEVFKQLVDFRVWFYRTLFGEPTDITDDFLHLEFLECR
jgi:hypothetical protein